MKGGIRDPGDRCLPCFVDRVVQRCVRDVAGAGRDGGGGGGDSTAVFEANFADIAADVNSRINLLWISCGTSDGLVDINREFKTWLNSRGVEVHEEEAEGLGHGWPLWREDLTNFAQRLFRG